MATVFAKKTKAEIQIQQQFSARSASQQATGFPVAVTCHPPFSQVESLVRGSRAPRKPNRNRPNEKNGVDTELSAWAEMEKDELGSERIDAIAEYLRKSGQASA